MALDLLLQGLSPATEKETLLGLLRIPLTCRLPLNLLR